MGPLRIYKLYVHQVFKIKPLPTVKDQVILHFDLNQREIQRSIKCKSLFESSFKDNFKIIIINLFILPTLFGPLDPHKWISEASFVYFLTIFIFLPLLLANNNGILLPKLFWPTVKKIVKWSRIFFKIIRTIYSNSERSEQFLVTECVFNLFLEVSQI